MHEHTIMHKVSIFSFSLSFNTTSLAFRTYHIVFHIISHIVYHIIYHIFHAYAGVVFHANSSFCMSIISYHSNYINISYLNIPCLQT